MALQVLRPQTDINYSNVTLVNGTTASTVLADTNPGSQVVFAANGSVAVSLSDAATLAALEVITQVRVRVRFYTGTTGITNTFVTLRDFFGNVGAVDFWGVNAPSGVPEFTGGWQTLAPEGQVWTEQNVNGLYLEIRDDGAGGAVPTVTEAFIDVQTSRAPTTTVTAPTGTVIDTNQPVVRATYADTENEPQTGYEVRVYSSGTYGLAGFSPDGAFTADWASGVVPGSGGANTTIGAALVGGAYRAYVRVKQAGPGHGSQWSAWAYSDFTINVSIPATPLLTATPNNSPVNTLVIQDRQNRLTANDASFETSIGGWTRALNCTLSRIAYGTGDGDYALDMASDAAGDMRAMSDYVGQVAGSYSSAQVHFFGVTTARSVRCDILFYDINNVVTGQVFGTPVPSATNAVAYCTAQAPANTTRVRVVATVLGTAAAGEHYYIDDVSLVAGQYSTFAWSRGGLVSSSRLQVQRRFSTTEEFRDITSRLYISTLDPGRLDLATFDYSDAEQKVTAYDFEVPRGTFAFYRARVVAKTPLGVSITSNWGYGAADANSYSGWWLTSPLREVALALPINVHSVEWSTKRAQRQGVFQALGRSNPVVLSDVAGGETGELSLSFPDGANYGHFERMHKEGLVLVLSSPYAGGTVDTQRNFNAFMYVRLGERTTTFLLKRGGKAVPIVSVPFIEVDP